MPSKKRKPKAKETTAITTGPTLVPQAHGGALNSGGTPGNKGGRPPDEWKAMLAHLTTRARTIGAASKILKNPDHPAYNGLLKWASARAYPELEPQLIAAKLRASVSNTPAPVGGITINFNFIQEGARFAEEPNVHGQEIESLGAEVTAPKKNGNGNGAH